MLLRDLFYSFTFYLSKILLFLDQGFWQAIIAENLENAWFCQQQNVPHLLECGTQWQNPKGTLLNCIE